PDASGDDATANRFAGWPLAGLPVPLPEDYVYGIDLQRVDFEARAMPSYLRGEWQLGGWWYYYLYALMIKTPVGTLVLVLLALYATTALRDHRGGRWPEAFLLCPAVFVLFLVSSQTGFNHHIRYVLPALPFLYIWVSKLGRAFSVGDRLMGVVASAALAWAVASSMLIYPHCGSYFNELVSGPEHGCDHLVDSNVDWGQDLFFLKSWLDRHGEARPLYLVYTLPLIEPGVLGIEYTVPSNSSPLPGWYAVSVGPLRGGRSDLNFLLRLKHYDLIGYSTYIFHVTREQADVFRAEMGEPWLPDDPSGRTGSSPRAGDKSRFSSAVDTR
ncbi:MAG: hypothetical protein ACP5XB_30675, partial [Isosphaeraceae bacterium]